MPTNAATSTPIDPLESLGQKFTAIRAARARISELYDQGALDEKYAKRRLWELNWLEAQLDAEQDAMDLTGPVSPVLTSDQTEQLASAVRRLAEHNVASDSARAIIKELFTLLGIATR